MPRARREAVDRRGLIIGEDRIANLEARIENKKGHRGFREAKTPMSSIRKGAD